MQTPRRSDTSVARSIAALANATTRLNQALAAVDPKSYGRPSLLPGWTIGHVVTHLARNADAQRNLLHWAETGEPTPMYPSRQARDADIESGSRLPGEDILADYRTSSGALAEAVMTLPIPAWSNLVGTARGGPVAATVVLHQRLAEVELHHHDLGVDGGLALLEDDEAVRLLSAVLRSFLRGADAVGMVLEPDGCGQITVGPGGPHVAGAPEALVAWLAGRGGTDDLRGTRPLPTVPSW